MNNMDHQSKQKNLKTLITKSLFLKKITQLLLSVSLFSLLLTNFSRLSFLCSFNSKFSTFPIQLLTHTLDKNYTFLLCNGILVFVAKFSGLISSSRKSNQSNNLSTLESYKYYDVHDHDTIVLESRVTLLEKEVVVDDNAQEDVDVDVEEGIQDNELYAITQEDRDVQGEELLIQGNEEQEEVELAEQNFEQGEVIELDDHEWSPPIQEDDEDDGEDEDDEGNGVLSTEELNKKFDEFIKKMKEELRIEAQQQYLVMVN